MVRRKGAHGLAGEATGRARGQLSRDYLGSGLLRRRPTGSSEVTLWSSQYCLVERRAACVRRSGFVGGSVSGIPVARWSSRVMGAVAHCFFPVGWWQRLGEGECKLRVVGLVLTGGAQCWVDSGGVGSLRSVWLMGLFCFV